MWPWPLLTSMASLPEHGTCDWGPPCTTHDTCQVASSGTLLAYLRAVHLELGRGVLLEDIYYYPSPLKSR